MTFNQHTTDDIPFDIPSMWKGAGESEGHNDTSSLKEHINNVKPNTGNTIIDVKYCKSNCGKIKIESISDSGLGFENNEKLR